MRIVNGLNAIRRSDALCLGYALEQFGFGSHRPLLILESRHLSSGIDSYHASDALKPCYCPGAPGAHNPCMTDEQRHCTSLCIETI